MSLIFFLTGVCSIRHGNGVEKGQILPSLSPYPTPRYLSITLFIFDGDEKLNLISVLDGFEYPRPILAIDKFFK